MMNLLVGRAAKEPATRRLKVRWPETHLTLLLQCYQFIGPPDEL